MSVDKRGQAEEVLTEILRLMGIRGRIEVKEVEAKEATDLVPAVPASISVALHLDEEVPGIVAGKRSQIVDALQFLSNKIVNRGPEKQWINIGVGAHPEPRIPGKKPEKAEKAPRPPKAEKPAPSPAPEAAPQDKKAERPARAEKKREEKPRRAAEQDEATLEVASDPAVERLGRLLAEKAAAFGRFYGVMPIAIEDRVRMMRGAQGVAGASVKVEGEGRHRRIVFVPAEPKPMPKVSALPDFDDEDELED